VICKLGTHNIKNYKVMVHIHKFTKCRELKINENTRLKKLN